MSSCNNYDFCYGNPLPADQSVESEINVFLEPNQALLQVYHHTRAGLMIGKAMVRFTRMQLDSYYPAFFANYPNPENNRFYMSVERVYECLYSAGIISEESAGSDSYVEVANIPFPVLQGLSARLALTSEYPKTSDFGIEVSGKQTIVWFVMHKVGKFAVNLQGISVGTATKLGILKEPLVYAPEEEEEILASLDVYPLCDVLWNRLRHADTVKGIEFPPLPAGAIRVNYYGRDLMEEDSDMLFASTVCS